jgi:hypothetical protein
MPGGAPTRGDADENVDRRRETNHSIRFESTCAPLRSAAPKKRNAKIFSQNEAKNRRWRYQKRRSRWLRSSGKPTKT